ncbi:MAG: hypothetical protein FWG89_00300 [Treponema sp.]|nr:hypothetical protein [Treponema sp.]
MTFWASERINEDVDIDGVTFGFTAGLFGSIPVGRLGLFILDARYIFDFSDVTVKSYGQTMDVAKRRGIALTAGYQLRF